MGRYPAEPLEDKLVWMRAKQRERQQKVAQAVAPLARPPLEPPQRQMLRVKEVAAILGVSASTVQRWFYRRALIVQGSRKSTMLISQRDLDDWIREHTNSR